jgi:hypothetical protein
LSPLRQHRQYKLYNPWPELAEEIWGSRCQPLINTVYLPTHDPDRFLQSCANGTSSTDEWVLLMHEYAHLKLNSTPIKEVARLYLGRIYDSLEELLHCPTDQWSEAEAKSFERFRTMHMHLSEIFGRMTLVEELLTAAFAFTTAEVVFQTKSKKELSEFERDSVRAFEKQFPDFQFLYYGIKEVFRLAGNQQQKHLLILGWLGIFLQPTDIGTVASSKERCKTLVDHVRPIENYTQLVGWLKGQIYNPSLIEDWQLILRLSMQYSQKSKNMRLLGEMSMANRLLIKKEVNYEDVVNLVQEMPNQYSSWPNGGGTLLPQVFLCPMERGNTRYIVPFNPAGNYNKYLYLLFLEAVLEQVNSGRRILWPFPFDATKNDYSCVPQPLLKQRMKRLARWAKEGRFGPRVDRQM